ncbi:MAG: glycogen/starch/alpha-glucan phosphorylase [Clostridiaceae bacterium]
MIIKDKEIFKNEYKKKLLSLFTEDVEEASIEHKYYALCFLVKEYTSESWHKTNKEYKKNEVKQVYYLSLEFLIGRLLGNNLLSLGLKDVVEVGLKELGVDLNELEEAEADAGLGNGGLGRLAACFLDSMASLQIPGHGCGIRYKYGLFEQKLVSGYQVETPDNWLKEGYPWEVRKQNKAVIVKYNGRVETFCCNGKLKFEHKDYEPVIAVPYDIPVIGYNNTTVNTLRLWSAETPNKDFDFSSFSKGDYLKAVAERSNVESITSVLYPDDSRIEGKILRLKQEYFLVSAGIQSIIRRYKKLNKPIQELPNYVAVHINDTHPTLAVPELMRILMDEEDLEWMDAFEITKKVMAYTNHTILSEALEKWPVDIMKSLLPRIYLIIEEINRRFVEKLRSLYGDDGEKIDAMAIIQNNIVNMAYLTIVGSHSVNGVAKLHTEILKKQELKNFYELYPEKFNNKTNGITHRRWFVNANPKLTAAVCEVIGDEWIKEPLKLNALNTYAEDSSFKEKVMIIKKDNKIELSNFLKSEYGYNIDPNSIYDMQLKRLHEYKRQLLNLIHIMYLYNRLKEDSTFDILPRTFFFAAKAAPSYYMAKDIIKLINSAAEVINNDKSIGGRLKIYFVPNYKVSMAEKLIPAADISEQISTATKEASGTGNMKFMMNGAITIATLDGANIEIKDAVGEENIVLFGLKDYEVLNYYKNGGYVSREIYENNEEVRRVIDNVTRGVYPITGNEKDSFYNALITNNDHYFVLKDFESYKVAQEMVNNLYKDKDKWATMAIKNIANSGIFSSDNTILRYSEEIWNTKKSPIK